MNGRKIITSLLSVGVALLLMGAEGCPRSTEPGKSVDTNPHEPNPRVIMYQVKISVRVKPAVAPYEVTIEARNVANPKEKEIIGPKPITGGPFSTTLDYNEGRTVYIQVTVKTSRPGDDSDGYCIIEDGQFNTKEGVLIGRTVSCILVTNRG